MSDHERQIREVIESKAATLKTGDVKTMLSYYAPEVVEFSLAPPLRQARDPRDPGPMQAWLATFEAPPTREVTQLEITAGDDVAFATSIDSMSAVPKGMTEGFTLWFRVTLGLRRIDGRWLITHQHDSVPFEMDGSFRASVDLKP
jgi:ketosteroid isomerase-like protein